MQVPRLMVQLYQYHCTGEFCYTIINWINKIAFHEVLNFNSL